MHVAAAIDANEAMTQIEEMTRVNQFFMFDSSV
jgi:hypothetical protein